MKRTFNQLSQSAVYKEDDTSVSLTVCGGSYGGGSEVLVVYAIHEADGQDVTMQKEVAYSLACGGGKPGQGYPCVMATEEETDELSRSDRISDA